MSQKSKLLAELGLTAQGGRDVPIRGLCVDSRKVQPGDLFAALPGSNVHGAAYADQVVKAGAAAILTDAEGAALMRVDVPVIVAQDPRATLAQTASLWFGAHPQTVVAVTGTNGKTSVSTFCRMIWEELGLAGVNLGTTGVEGVWTDPTGQSAKEPTTPQPITLHRILADAAAADVTHVAMEASSHGLDQRRMEGVLLTAAGFTNLTQDHLDYHGSFEAYFDAKMGLFTRVLAEDGVAVINLDDPKGPEVAQICAHRGQEVIGVGRHADARLKLEAQRFDATGQDLRFTWQGRPYQVRLNLIGGFQAENVLLAAGMVIGAGAAPGDVFDVLGNLTGVRGRMELAATRENGAAVFVDYAHTPDAVATALSSMRPHVMGRLVVILGAGGDRDPAKRPLMGRAAADHADAVIITDDNPRSEDPSSIRAAVLAGAVQGAAEVTEVGDRAEAILRGIDALGAGDTLLIAGKGHESGQIVGDTVLPFDDVEQASVAVAALEGRV